MLKNETQGGEQKEVENMVGQGMFGMAIAKQRLLGKIMLTFSIFYFALLLISYNIVVAVLFWLIALFLIWRS